jgi:LemA protein
MTPIFVLGAFVLLVVVAWSITTYNRFIKYKNAIEESWSGIDVALKRRSNLIPNLIRSVEGYSKHEANLFHMESIHPDASTDIPNRAEDESRISQSLQGLLALAQAYPDLKASANFIDLQNSLDEIEEDIQKARNRYNSFVGRFNTLVESFPSSLIAGKYGFKKQLYFTLDLATQRELPTVAFSASSTSGEKSNS